MNISYIIGMDIKHLVRTDLNLLITLQILLEEKSVSRAADRLYLTQPAISKSLSRLRELFNDPLFTRSGRGLVATPFADSLRTPLEKVLGDLSNLFIAEEFDPGLWEGEINIAVNEFIDMSLVPMLIADLSSTAPGMHINTFTQLDNQLLLMEQGELDFVMNIQFAEIPEGFESEVLFSDRPCLFARSGHPLMKKEPVPLSEGYTYPRVALNLPDMDKLDIFRQGGREELDRTWDVSFETENLITALSVISKTNYVLLGPGLMTRFIPKGIHVKSVEVQVEPDFFIHYCLVSHDRIKASPVHQWLRQHVRGMAAKIM